MLSGEFDQDGRSWILHLTPDRGRLRLGVDRLRKMCDYYAGASTVSDQVLPRCWVPRELARRWCRRRDLPWPRRLDPFDLSTRYPVFGGPFSIPLQPVLQSLNWRIAAVELPDLRNTHFVGCSVSVGACCVVGRRCRYNWLRLEILGRRFRPGPLSDGGASGGGPAFVRLGRRRIVYRVADVERWLAEWTFSSRAD
jgi:hypothetical protein